MPIAVVGVAMDVSPWSRDSLDSLRDLNHRFLDLAAAGGGPGGIAARAAPLTPVQRAAAAGCPYALFDLRFHDGLYWRERLAGGRQWLVADSARSDAASIDFTRLALFYAWHIAALAGLRGQVLLGMHADTAEAFRGVTVERLPALASSEAQSLRARWSDRAPYWNALLGAATGSETAALRRVQLYGLQLAAATQLPQT